jgi:hypothetical protein
MTSPKGTCKTKSRQFKPCLGILRRISIKILQSNHHFRKDNVSSPDWRVMSYLPHSTFVWNTKECACLWGSKNTSATVEVAQLPKVNIVCALSKIKCVRSFLLRRTHRHCYDVSMCPGAVISFEQIGALRDFSLDMRVFQDEVG